MKRLLIMLMLLCAPLNAATYYVTKAGGGSTCSVGSPCLTIQAGIAKLTTPGDILDIAVGTYTESISSYSYTIASGTLASPIIIRAHSGDTVWLKPAAGATANGIDLRHTNHDITFDGINVDMSLVTGVLSGVKIASNTGLSPGAPYNITIKNAEIKGACTGRSDSGTPQCQGIYVGQYSTGCSFQTLHVHHNGASFNYDHGFYVTPANTLIENCEVNNNKEYGIQVQGDTPYPTLNTIVRNNKVYANGSGIYIGRGATTVKVYNNLVYGQTGSTYGGLGIYTSNSSNTQIYNNTVYGNYLVGISNGYGTNTPSPNAIIRNNIAYSNGGAYQIGGTGTTPTYSNNLCSGSVTSGCSVVTTNPRFTNAGTDFTLIAGSPAIETGYDLSATFTTDYAGVTRKNGSTTGSAFEMGAYEYASPPNSLTLLVPSNTGISWEIGTTQTITWTSQGAGSTVELTADLDGNGSYETPISASTPNDGSFDWDTTSLAANANCKVKVKDTGDTTNDVSNNVFALTAATVTGTITIVTPAASATYNKGTSVIISWTSTDVSGNVLIELSRNNGNTWSTIGTYAYNATDIVYTATTPSSSNCKIRITSVNDSNVTATSSAFRLGGRIM